MTQLSLSLPVPSSAPDPGYVVILLPKFFPTWFACFFCRGDICEYDPDQAAVEVYEDRMQSGSGYWHTAHVRCIAIACGCRRAEDRKLLAEVA